MQICIGVDDGNFDTKTQNTTTPNGFSEHASLPAISPEYLKYDGKYYIPEVGSRFYYTEDKTKSNRSYILSLFGIAKEIIHKCGGFAIGKEILQEKVIKYNKVVIGVGLPITHFGTYKKSKQEYFERHMGKVIEFIYNDISFSFEIIFCAVFPQCYAAVATQKDEIIMKYEDYVGIDLGGGTMDVVFIENKQPVISKLVSESVGAMFMYQDIVKRIKQSYNVTLSYANIESIIQQKPTVIKEDVQCAVNELTQGWVDNNIIGKLSQMGIDFATLPSVFFGGYAVLMKPFIKKNPIIDNYHFLKNPVNANARGYALMVKQMLKKA